MIDQPTLNLPDAPEFTAKLAIANLIEQHPLLQGQFNTFLTYTGEKLDEADADRLPRPFFRMRAYPGPSKWFAAGQHQFPVFFSFEIGLEGTSDREILKIWNALRTILSPTKLTPWQDTNPGQTVLNYLMANGLNTWEIPEAAYGVRTPDDGTERWMYGTALMTGLLLVNT